MQFIQKRREKLSETKCVAKQAIAANAGQNSPFQVEGSKASWISDNSTAGISGFLRWTFPQIAYVYLTWRYNKIKILFKEGSTLQYNWQACGPQLILTINYKQYMEKLYGNKL